MAVKVVRVDNLAVTAPLLVLQGGQLLLLGGVFCRMENLVHSSFAPRKDRWLLFFKDLWLPRSSNRIGLIVWFCSFHFSQVLVVNIEKS